jgi:hypothetical protein
MVDGIINIQTKLFILWLPSKLIQFIAQTITLTTKQPDELISGCYRLTTKMIACIKIRLACVSLLLPQQRA